MLCEVLLSGSEQTRSEIAENEDGEKKCCSPDECKYSLSHTDSQEEDQRAHRLGWLMSRRLWSMT